MNRNREYVLRIYLNPKAIKKGFSITELTNWEAECVYECTLDAFIGASSMSRHCDRRQAIDQARKELGSNLFNQCF